MAITPPWSGATFWGKWRDYLTGAYVSRFFIADVHANFPTISGASVGLPANTVYVDPSDGRVVRTV